MIGYCELEAMPTDSRRGLGSELLHTVISFCLVFMDFRMDLSMKFDEAQGMCNFSSFPQIY